MKHSPKFFMILLCLTLTLLSACSGKKDATADLSGTPKIVFGDEAFFHDLYGQFFHAKFPNVDIEIISQNEMYRFLAENDFDNRKFLETYEPDIIRIDSLQQYAELAEAGVLVDLDALIKTDGYDIGSIDGNVMELLRKPVGGGLYALAPRFDNYALYYNIDLFNEHGVDPPRDGMTWDEVFELAGRFPADGDPKERIAGFSDRTDLSSLVIQMAEAESLSLYAGLNNEPTFPSDRWRAVIERVVEAGRSGALYVPGVSEITDFNPPGYVQTNLFVAGRSAMTVDHLLPDGPYPGDGLGIPQVRRRRRTREAPVEIFAVPAFPLRVHEGEGRSEPRAVLQVPGQSGREAAARRALPGVQRLPFRADPGAAESRRRRTVDRRGDRGDRAGDGGSRIADPAVTLDQVAARVVEVGSPSALKIESLLSCVIPALYATIRLHVERKTKKLPQTGSFFPAVRRRGA